MSNTEKKKGLGTWWVGGCLALNTAASTVIRRQSSIYADLASNQRLSYRLGGIKEELPVKHS